MRKLLILAILGALVPSATLSTPPQTVYITTHGKKFHAGGCRSLWNSKIAISRTDAVKRGYDACRVCKP